MYSNKMMGMTSVNTIVPTMPMTMYAVGSSGSNVWVEVKKSNIPYSGISIG
jgi:hypothetical protein